MGVMDHRNKRQPCDTPLEDASCRLKWQTCQDDDARLDTTFFFCCGHFVLAFQPFFKPSNRIASYTRSSAFVAYSVIHYCSVYLYVPIFTTSNIVHS